LVDEAFKKEQLTPAKFLFSFTHWVDEAFKNESNSLTGVPENGRWPANLIHDGSDEVVELFQSESARFFYCAKASKADRDEGCGRLDYRQYSHDGRQTPIDNAYQRNNSEARNHHPTVKPTDLMRYLCRLVTQPNGVVLDPFMGSGSTGKAAILENFRFIGIEKDREYVEIAKHRLEKALSQGRLEGI
jgi:site-specific DNA-methyltransferase (adenine-specific)